MASDQKNYFEHIKVKVPEISVEALKALHLGKKPLRLVDVREKSEVLNGVIPGATHISRSFLELTIETLEPNLDQPLVLYCSVGNRSLLAADTLMRMGYQDVSSLSGGFKAWLSSGGDIETNDGLNEKQLDRYQRHIALPEVKEEGQKKLLQAKIAVVGVGGLGCPASLYLAAAGIGTLGLIDPDHVDRSNLQRQILFSEAEIGQKKVEAAKRKLLNLNPDIQIQTHPVRLEKDNGTDILKNYDYVLNGCDNFPSRYLVNDACYFLKKPLIDGSIFRFEGQVSIHLPDQGPCYRCLYADPPEPENAPSCQEAGVFGVLPGIIGCVQAIETIKLILNFGTPLIGRLLLFEAKSMQFRELKLSKDPHCPLCGTHKTVTELIDYQGFCGLKAL